MPVLPMCFELPPSVNVKDRPQGRGPEREGPNPSFWSDIGASEISRNDWLRILVAELKLKTSQLEQFFMFLISALPPEGAFQMFIHFWHVWPLGQKRVIQIFERHSDYKIIKQNIPGGSDF